MKIRIKTISVLLLSVFFIVTSCENNNPIDEEQYFKQVYIVGAAQVVSSFEIPYADEAQEAYISIATGGSLNIDQDVTVTLGHNSAMIDWYNNKYMIDAPVQYQELGTDRYNIPSMTTTVKAGDVYSRLPFEVYTDGLDCDSLYALTFEIQSVSAYQKNAKDSVLILNFSLINDYSDNYQLSIIRYVVSATLELTLPTTASATRVLKAVDKNTVRFFNETKAELRSSYSSNEAYFNAIKSYCVTFTKDEDNSFIVKAWGELNIVDPGECTYDNGVFSFWYDYMEGTQRYRIQGTLGR
ncbi:hypothetical protein EZS27_021638 [termite gut metagenome]|uniref:DUF1735 domain-containing protein n=1 Tax=termite gut metagenome TaxID=433724 RepID=A0A5J4R7E5_9ZZZZ